MSWLEGVQLDTAHIEFQAAQLAVIYSKSSRERLVRIANCWWSTALSCRQFHCICFQQATNSAPNTPDSSSFITPLFSICIDEQNVYNLQGRIINEGKFTIKSDQRNNMFKYIHICFSIDLILCLEKISDLNIVYYCSILPMHLLTQLFNSN